MFPLLPGVETRRSREGEVYVCHIQFIIHSSERFREFLSGPKDFPQFQATSQQFVSLNSQSSESLTIGSPKQSKVDLGICLESQTLCARREVPAHPRGLELPRLVQTKLHENALRALDLHIYSGIIRLEPGTSPPLRVLTQGHAKFPGTKQGLQSLAALSYLFASIKSS